MKLIPLVLTHRLITLGENDIDVPVHLYVNRLEGDINLNGLEDVKIIEKNGKYMVRISMNYTNVKISFLKRHKKTFDLWVKECYDSTFDQKQDKKNLIFEGLFDSLECYGSYISSFELNRSQEELQLACDKMVYTVEMQVLSKSVKQNLENRLK